MKLDQLLQQMLSQNHSNAVRLPKGLALRYTPPRPGDVTPIHTLSLSRRDNIDPSNSELRTVHEALIRLRPHAQRAVFSRAQKGDMMIRRIIWRENWDQESNKTNNQKEEPQHA